MTLAALGGVAGVVVLTAAVLGAVALCVASGNRRWTRLTRRLGCDLDAACTNPPGGPDGPARFHAGDLAHLPVPVQRYLLRVLTEGQPMVAGLTLAMVGTFNLSTTAERWRPFTARQRVITRRPGFLWDARVSLVTALGVRVNVVDSYVAGTGLLRAAIPGLFTLANVGGSGELARGELMRFVAEAAWYPTVLLPGQGVRWTAVDDASADATLSDGVLSLTLRFRFNAAGLIDTVHTDARGAMVGGQLLMMPWSCALSDYAVRDGMTVPLTGEAAWVRPEGRAAYFRGKITAITYQFAE